MKNARHGFYLLLVAVVFTACGNSKQDMILMDKEGNFYQLYGHGTIAAESYRLRDVDTTIFKVKGFNCN